MAWNDNLYTIDYGNNQWMIARVIFVDAAGYRCQDSRGNETILPKHEVHRLTKRNGW